MTTSSWSTGGTALHLSGSQGVAPTSPYLQHISSDVILEGPVQGVQDLEDFVLLQHTEQPVQKDLQADRDGLGPIQHEAADVEHHVGLDDLHLACGVHGGDPQLTQS